MENFFDLEEEDFEMSDEDELVTRYEGMLRNRQFLFFDEDDYEQLYFHYTQFYGAFYLVEKEQQQKGGAVIKRATDQYPNSKLLQLLQLFHFYKEDRIRRTTLLDKLAKVRLPDYEWEHFTYVLAHIYRQLNEKSKALYLFNYLLEHADLPEDKTVLYYEILFLYETAEQAPLAVEYCNKILKTEKISMVVLFWKMYEYYLLKPIAIPVFKLLTKQYTFSMESWLFLGKAYMDVASIDAAIQAFRYAVAVSDNESLPLVSLGRVLILKDNVSEAVECFQEAMEIDPDQTGLYTEMGEILCSSDNFEHAKYFFSLALDIDKNDVNALMGMALALYSSEQYNDSIAYIMRAKKVEPLSIEALLLLADNYIEVNRDDEALEIFQHLEKQYPKDVDVWLSYSNYYAMIEDFEQACNIAKHGLAVLHDNAYLLYRIANYCFLGRDIPQGITYLRLAYCTDSKLISFFADYDENVMKIPEVVQTINSK